MNIDKLVLGTAQFGLNYGINNISGKPSEQKVFDILDTAYQNGIKYLDTADAYGNAHQLIGKYHKSVRSKFKVFSKFKGVKSGELQTQIRKSLDLLNIDSFNVYSFHSILDFLENPGILNELLEIKDAGLIKNIGISVYTNPELEKVIDTKHIDVVQIPFNILDNYNLRGSLIEKAVERNKEIHIRSVFLQGLFFMTKFPAKLKPLESYLSVIKNFCRSESLTIQQLALSYALFNTNISNVLIGVDNSDQLINNLREIKLNNKAFEFINKNIIVKETELLNPVNWK